MFVELGVKDVTQCHVSVCLYMYGAHTCSVGQKIDISVNAPGIAFDLRTGTRLVWLLTV